MEDTVNDDRYLPDCETLENGVIVESYGRAHTQRQADAQALLNQISWAESAITTTVRCGCKRRARLATVYRTLPAVICIHPETHTDPEMMELRMNPQLAEIDYGSDVFTDILHAPEDRDLEARCRDCGRHELDRQHIIEAVDLGLREWRIAQQP